MTNKSLKKGAGIKHPPVKKVRPENQGSETGFFGLPGITLIILLGLTIYSNSFDCSFHFDDEPHIVYNQAIRDLSDVQAWLNNSPHRPVSIFTFALTFHFFGLDLFYWHLGNILIHLVNAVLVWWLTFLMFSSPALKDNQVAKDKKIPAFIVALLFVSHPLATQSVTYIIQRMTSLAAMFYLLSLALYLKARLTEKRVPLKILLFSGTVISAVLAMLTKENAFTLPFSILLAEFFFVRTKRFSVNFRDYRVIGLAAAFLAVVLIIPLRYSFSVFEPMPPRVGQVYTLTPVNYLFTQFSVIVKYIGLLIFPVNLHLEYDYPVSNSFFEIRTVLGFLTILALLALAVFLFRKQRVISFGIFWFFLTLSIESSIIPIQDVMVEHRTYLPSFGFFLVLGSGIYLWLWKKYKYAAMAFLSTLVFINSFLTYSRNKTWKDDLTLLTDNVARAPHFARPFNNRGVVYWKQKEYDKAIADFNRAIGINPRYADPYYNRGVVYENTGRYDKAVEDYSRAIIFDGKNAKTLYNCGVAYLNLGKFGKAVEKFTAAVRIRSDYAEAYNNRGVGYENLGKYNQAITDFSRAAGISPGYPDPYFNRGATYWTLKKFNQAISDYTTVIGIRPDYKEAYVYRAVAYGDLGQWDKAIADYSKALEIDPNYAQASSLRELACQKLKSTEHPPKKKQ